MPRVLILSSFVAASRVGGGAQALALARLGVEPVLAPTVLFGRHPGLGAPGGGAVSAEVFEGVLAGVEAAGGFARLDAVVTGFFTTPEQVAIAADGLDRIKAASTAARIVVDPIMGDDGGPYVREVVAEAIAVRLIPRADLVRPNSWELARLTGASVGDPPAALAAARRLGRPTIVSSVDCDGAVGVVYADRDRGWLATHARAPAAPKGTGDLLTAYATAGLVQGLDPREVLALAVGAVAELVAAHGAHDPPAAALPTRLADSARVRVEALGG